MVPYVRNTTSDTPYTSLIVPYINTIDEKVLTLVDFGS